MTANIAKHLPPAHKALQALVFLASVSLAAGAAYLLFTMVPTGVSIALTDGWVWDFDLYKKIAASAVLGGGLTLFMVKVIRSKSVQIMLGLSIVSFAAYAVDGIASYEGLKSFPDSGIWRITLPLFFVFAGLLMSLLETLELQDLFKRKADAGLYDIVKEVRMMYMVRALFIGVTSAILNGIAFNGIFTGDNSPVHWTLGWFMSGSFSVAPILIPMYVSVLAARRLASMAAEEDAESRKTTQNSVQGQKPHKRGPRRNRRKSKSNKVISGTIQGRSTEVTKQAAV
ncbi:MAG: hypothetical protein GC134_07210 [Proteobacteria bacterium]|nr:hypothetical protein [Pseudomonadota bacterium]